ncbi:hypothetical protein GQ53DRAFT_334731 [Thozetella sp. PMI_491]|nr:hypothetical protein GQ53DRAFT_334731 [Thozetella sp. PMI_491]
MGLLGSVGVVIMTARLTPSPTGTQLQQTKILPASAEPWALEWLTARSRMVSLGLHPAGVGRCPALASWYGQGRVSKRRRLRVSSLGNQEHACRRGSTGGGLDYEDAGRQEVRLGTRRRGEEVRLTPFSGPRRPRRPYRPYDRQTRWLVAFISCLAGAGSLPLFPPPPQVVARHRAIRCPRIPVGCRLANHHAGIQCM